MNRVCAIILFLVIVLANVRLYRISGEEWSSKKLGSDVLAQLCFIGDALHDGAGERMQKYFPEGFFFSHVLYGLAWVEVGMRQKYGSSLYIRALDQARWALDRLDSPVGRAPFVFVTEPPMGVFYMGWTNWLRGGILKLQPAQTRNADEAARFASDCMALAKAFRENTTPFLSSYPGRAWPVDSVIAVAALCLHDRLLGPCFGKSVNNWLLSVRNYLDPATGLLPHSVDPETGLLVQGARGSSQSLIHRFLVEIDPVWGSEQYVIFRRHFITTLMGVPGVREYPHGVDGPGDIDSGPLVGGLSASATVVAIGAAQMNGDQMLVIPLLNLIESIGFPITWKNTKRYGFGLLPVGDAFLVWSKTARPWIAELTTVSLTSIVPDWWRLPLHGLGLCLMLFIWRFMWPKSQNMAKLRIREK
jgi:hypothetical protein